ncbi:hypothetical protein NDU88_002614 [Pleurodeles waltl]|uniref:Uncharacterized protein n=1 Tax=Pleurodeles waltl TaxID=8319 RepID=A0AAV7RG77_PLEWA|nr:hypothetical protein NDU88_002614 [Pleurodeles waltl]
MTALLGFSDLPTLTPDQQSFLAEPWTGEEFLLALQNAPTGSAPDKDGIPWEFYRLFWKEICVDFIEVLQEGFTAHTIPQAFPEGIVTLIFKKASDGKEAKQRARALSSSTAFSASEEERDRKSKIGKVRERKSWGGSCLWQNRRSGHCLLLLPAEDMDRVLFLLSPATNSYERLSLIYRPKQSPGQARARCRPLAARLLSRVARSSDPGAGPSGQEGEGHAKTRNWQRGYANGRIMRRLLRTLSRETP